MEEIKKAISLYETELIQLRRALHQTPEIGLNLPKTSAFVKNYLQNLGLSVKEYVNGNGFSTVIKGEKKNVFSNKVIALRADMDGLPISEETDLDFKSINGNMHACGHDGHTAILLIVAKLLATHKELFSGRVKLIFQPGEEYPGGAEPMIKEGVLENPKVTRMIGFHIGHLDPSIPTGCISTRIGPLMASMDKFQITVHGKGTHGAYPENANDPIIAANAIISAIQTIKSRNLQANDPVVISVTHIESGKNQNIIPDQAFIEGTVRATKEKNRELVRRRMLEICEGISVAFNVKCDLNYLFKYPVLINERQSTTNTVKILAEHFGKEKVLESRHCLMSGEDFAFFAQEIPSTFLFYANPRKINGKFYGHHSPKFDFIESELIHIVQAFVLITLDYLNYCED